jgi:DNA-binding transcriptional ArsR family regulator
MVERETDVNAVLKALSNETRLQILEWLKDPHRNFGHQEIGDFDEDGVCVSLIQKKAGLSQSTTSIYLGVLLRAGLVRAKRIGQWTYYQRDEEAIQRFQQALAGRISV